MRKRMLIIDDEKDYAHFIKTNMELTGNFVVLAANRGKAGMRATIKENPHPILLDVIMPGRDGFRIKIKIVRRAQRRAIQWLAPQIFLPI